RKFVWYAMLHSDTARNGLKPYQILLAKKYRHVCDDFVAKHHHPPTLSELEDFSGINVKQLIRMLKASQTTDPLSLDEPYQGINSNYEIEWDVIDENASNPEEVVIEKENEQLLE